MAVTLKGDDLRQQSETTLYTPAGLKLFHGDHGLSFEHLTFIDEVMSEVGEGETVVKAFLMPEGCPDLDDAIYGPCNGDSAVTDEECYFASRADRDTKSRLLDREPRPGARWMVIIGTKGVALWTAYGSLSGTVAPKEADDQSLSPEEAEAAREFWSVHALARQRQVVNLTPHPLNLRDRHGDVINFAKPELDKSELPRVAQTTQEVGFVGDFVDHQSSYGQVMNLPEDDGRVYVVSRLVISACQEQGVSHSHLRSPGSLIRDDDGKIIGAEGLAR